MNKVYVKWNTLHEKVVCVHTDEDSTCPACEKAWEDIKHTGYCLKGDWFEVNLPSKEEKIKELEAIQAELQKRFESLISKPITEKTIEEAKTIGVDIISDSINNNIMLDILNWDDDTKLSEMALRYKNKNHE